MSETRTPESAANAPSSVECPAGKDPFVRLLIGAGMGFSAGIWCLLDLKHFPYAPYSEDINKFAGWAFNHGLAVLAPLTGLIVLGFAIRLIRRKLLADQEGIGYVGKQKYAWADATRLDASQLKGKGLLFLHFGQVVLKLDSWKLQNFKQLVALIESKVPKDKQTR